MQHSFLYCFIVLFWHLQNLFVCMKNEELRQCLRLSFEGVPCIDLFCVCVVSEGSIQIEQGLFISAVHSGWVIGKDGMLPSFGDRIISVRMHFLGS